MIAEGVVLSPGTSIRAVHGVGWELHDSLRKRHWLAVPEGQHLNFKTVLPVDAAAGSAQQRPPRH